MLHMNMGMYMCADLLSKTVKKFQAFVFVCMQESVGVVRWLIRYRFSGRDVLRVRQCLDLTAPTF